MLQEPIFRSTLPICQWASVATGICVMPRPLMSSWNSFMNAVSRSHTMPNSGGPAQASQASSKADRAAVEFGWDPAQTYRATVKSEATSTMTNTKCIFCLTSGMIMKSIEIASLQ